MRFWVRSGSVALSVAALAISFSASAWPETPSYIELIAGKKSTVRLCPISKVGASVCTELTAVLTGAAPPPPIAPTLTIATVDDSRLQALGAGCPKTGADIRGDPYEPYELDFSGERAKPKGPFEFFDLSAIYPEWKDAGVVRVQGYGPTSFGQPTPAFGWTSFYVLKKSIPCPLIEIISKYVGGFDQPTPIRYANDLIRSNGIVMLIEVAEVGAATGIYYVSVHSMPASPPMPGARGEQLRSLILTFTVE